MLNDATPPLNEADPAVAPSMVNVTKPVGVGPPLTGTTVAVNVTDCPNTDGFGTDVTLVADGGRLTTCVSPPVLVLKFPSPLYATDTGCDPTGNAAVL